MMYGLKWVAVEVEIYMLAFWILRPWKSKFEFGTLGLGFGLRWASAKTSGGGSRNVNVGFVESGFESCRMFLCLEFRM